MGHKRTNIKGIVTAAGNAAVEFVVLSAHHSWQASARVGRTLSLRHVALRLEAVGRTLAAEAEIASRR